MRSTRDIGVHICQRMPLNLNGAGVWHDLLIDFPKFEAR